MVWSILIKKYIIIEQIIDASWFDNNKSSRGVLNIDFVETVIRFRSGHHIQMPESHPSDIVAQLLQTPH